MSTAAVGRILPVNPVFIGDIEQHRTRLDYRSKDASAVERGLPNLVKQVENVRAFGEVPVVTLNRFANDTEGEVDVVRRACRRLTVPFAVCDGYAEGGAGAVELARAVVRQAEHGATPFRPLYEWSEPIKVKLEKVAHAMYGADSVAWDRRAERDLAVLHRCCGEGLPLCVAKTPASLSDNAKLIGRPEGFGGDREPPHRGGRGRVHRPDPREHPADARSPGLSAGRADGLTPSGTVGVS